MENPSAGRGLSFTVSWGPLDDPRSLSVSLGAALRVALAASLCAGAYEAGRWHERLLAQASRPASAVVVVERADKPAKPEKAGTAAGRPAGESSDVITPLNVRDPTALVMGPADPRPAPAAAPPAGVPDVNPPPRVYKKAKDIKPSDRFKPNQSF